MQHSHDNFLHNNKIKEERDQFMHVQNPEMESKVLHEVNPKQILHFQTSHTCVQRAS